MARDEKITEELMTNLKAAGTETKDLSKMLSKRIIGVRLNAGRGKMQVIASDKALGIKQKASSTAATAFKKNNIKAGAFLLFPEEVIASFVNLYANIRQTMLRYAISKEGSTYYMTSENYEAFKYMFENTYTTKFEAKKEDLLSKLDTYKVLFKSSLEEWLKEVVDDETVRNRLLTFYVSKFPTAAEFKKDCQISLALSAYPVVEESQLKGMNGSIAKDIMASTEEASIDTLYQMTLANLEEAFKTVEKIAGAIDIVSKADEERVCSLKMGSRTKGLLNDTIEYIENNNYALNNDFLKTLTFLIRRSFILQQNVEGKPLTNKDAVAMAENILGAIYGYAKHIGMEDTFEEDVLKSSDYDAESLELIADFAPDIEAL